GEDKGGRGRDEFAPVNRSQNEIIIADRVGAHEHVDPVAVIGGESGEGFRDHHNRARPRDRVVRFDRDAAGQGGGGRGCARADFDAGGAIEGVGQRVLHRERFAVLPRQIIGGGGKVKPVGDVRVTV